MSSKIAIQGAEASYHDIAAGRLFPAITPRLFCESFSDIFEALGDDTTDYGLCAVENSLYGSINEVYDLLFTHKPYIVGEVYLRIKHCLIGLPGADVSRLAKVYSHPIALAQCTAYLDTTLRHAEREEYYDTAGSVCLIKESGNPAFAAIASEQAAELYGLPILARSIETNKQNFTRFIALSKAKATGDKLNKTSLILTTDHQPGALYEALGAFARHSLNLTKLQSRPIIGKAWHFMFYIDVEENADAPRLHEALQELAAQGCKVTVLGSYQAHPL